MDIHTNIPLKNYTTMKLGGNARFIADILKPEDIPPLLDKAFQQSLPVAILGGGSNTIVRDEGYDGVILRIRIPGITTISEELNSVTIKIGAGELWDNVVAYAVDLRLSGIEAMSAIPGTAGAAPVQNVGAYGQEIADTLVSLEAYDTEARTFVTLFNEDCRFNRLDIGEPPSLNHGSSPISRRLTLTSHITTWAAADIKSLLDG